MKNPAELLLMGANPMAAGKPYRIYWGDAEVGAKKTMAEAQEFVDKSSRRYAKKLRESGHTLQIRYEPQANPAGSRNRNGARLNPMFNTNFTEDEKLALGRLGIKWSAIQTAADVRRARKALKTMEKARAQFGNPSMPMSEQRERAAEIYSGFHATEHENKIVMDEPHIPAGAYPELGLLYQVYFKPTNPKAEDSYEKVYVCEKENTHVIGTLDREQIYFAAGDQKLDDQMLRTLGWDGEDRFHIGEARKIVYLAYKYHDAVPKEGRGKLVEWIHEFGEKTGVRPQLWYDHGNARLYLKHGEYEIQNEGIVN